jgi:hypothetical protein
MYEYENANVTLIGTANIYQGVDDFSTGLLNGFTFVAGDTGVIASTADYGVVGGDTVTVTDVAHGLLTGDIVTIHGTTSYNGTFAITKLTDDTYYIVDTWVANESGTWAMGSYLRCSTGSEGIYSLSMNNTSWGAVTGKVFKFELNKNVTPLDNIACSQRYVNTDYQAISSSGLISLVAGDRIWMSVMNQTDANDITVRHANITIHKQ